MIEGAPSDVIVNIIIDNDHRGGGISYTQL